jgi:exopolysaccharide production protein ExoZ
MNTRIAPRIHTLDYLRGILAFSVMIYHVTVWNNITLRYPLNTLISRLGIYAVSAFYVISGASLAIVYFNRQINKAFLFEFTVKRVLRIAPLMFFATSIYLLLFLMEGGFAALPGAYKLIVNYLLIFGWVSPSSYIVTGAWSIGNELVFYSALPVLLYAFQRSKRIFLVFVIVLFVISFYFSFFILDSKKDFEGQWNLYINPLNQIHLFVGGLLIGFFIKKNSTIPRKFLLFILFGAILLFIFYPVSSTDHIHIVTGVNRIVFSLLIFAICFAIGTWGITKENIVNRTLKFLGNTSYSIYLLHPLVSLFVLKICRILTLNSIPLKVGLTIAVTLVSARISYDYIEKPFISKSSSRFKKINKPLPLQIR